MIRAFLIATHFLEMDFVTKTKDTLAILRRSRTADDDGLVKAVPSERRRFHLLPDTRPIRVRYKRDETFLKNRAPRKFAVVAAYGVDGARTQRKPIMPMRLSGGKPPRVAASSHLRSLLV